MSIKAWKDIVESGGSPQQTINASQLDALTTIGDGDMVRLLNASGYVTSLREMWDVGFKFLTISGGRIVAVYEFGFPHPETGDDDVGTLYVSIASDGSVEVEY